MGTIAQVKRAAGKSVFPAAVVERDLRTLKKFRG